MNTTRYLTALFTLALVSVSSDAIAQSACLSMNTNGSSRNRISSSQIFTFRANTGSSPRAFGSIELYFRARSSTQTVTVSIYDAKGPHNSGRRLASGTMTVPTTNGWHRANFAQPALLPANTNFWISFDRASAVYMPTVLPGTNQTHYHYFGRWSGPWSGTWAWKLYCKTGTVASYSTFGSSCSGSAPKCSSVLSANWTAPLASKQTKSKKIAILCIPSNAPKQICGAALRLTAKSSPVDVNVELYESTPSLGIGKRLTGGSMRVTTRAGAYRMQLAQPAPMPSLGFLYLVFDKADQLQLPITTSGVQGTHLEYNGTSWSSVQTTENWTYQLLGDQPAKQPTLAAQGRPVLGTTITIALDRARPNSAALFALGTSRTQFGPIKLPFSLNPHAPGCTLFCSLEALVVTPTTAFGTATVQIPIPNDTRLRGAPFFNQFLVIDPPANALNIVTTNGGAGIIGDF